MKKNIIFSISVLICIVIITFGVLQPPESSEPPHNKNQHIVFISIDTLRADHLSCYGYPRQTTPFLDELAQGGVLFEKAFAQMSTTAPSHTTMFTGLYPLEHNIQKNGHKLDDSFVTIAEVLQKHNYQTVGFASTNTHFNPSNISQGFDHFNEPTDEYIHESVRDTGKKYRKATDTINTALKWLTSKQPKENVFLFVHLFDPHRWLNPPQKHIDKVLETSPDKETFLDFLTSNHHLEMEFYQNNAEKLLETIDKYDGEIRYVDTELRRLFNFIEKKWGSENTLWIITADHGEGFGAHMYGTHGKNIYNEQIHIPLIFYPSRPNSPRKIDALVEHVDLLPTICELADINTNKIIPYQLEGFSLVPFFTPQDKRNPHRTFSFSQRRIYEKKPAPTDPPQSLLEYEDGEKFSIQNKNYKYIQKSAGADELYHIKNDPYEVDNMINQNPELEDTLQTRINNKVEMLRKKFSTKKSIVDKKTIKNLKDLGYIQ